MFSGATLDGIHAADPVLRRALTEHPGGPAGRRRPAGRRARLADKAGLGTTLQQVFGMAEGAELGERVCVFVVPEPGLQVSLGAIADGMAAAGVARFTWPERLEIVAELPVTKVGKLDKKALRDMLAGRSTP